jgi:hypothetical protein
MSRANEVWREFQDGVTELRVAIAAASDCWEREPAEHEWPPRIVAEHIIPATVIYLEFAADALRRESFAWSEVPHLFETVGDAEAGLRVVYGWASETFGGLTDAMLDVPVDAMTGSRLPPTVEGALRRVINHMRQHTQQILDAIPQPASPELLL